jgi:hypothetical protein
LVDDGRSITRSRLSLLLAASVLLGAVLGAARAFGGETPSASPSAELQATVDVLGKAPMVLILSTSQHYLDKKRWPTAYQDISYVAGSNAHVLPKGFAFKKVTFVTVSRKECDVAFSFDWPALEGGVASGTIRIQAGGSLKDMARTAKLTWAKPPKLRADLQPAAPVEKPAADTPAK